MKRLALLPVLLAGIAGCGSVASPAYQGEPIASFHGYVLWEKKEPIVPVDLVMFWPDWSRTPVAGGTIVQIPVRVPLRADAPARFDFAVFEPAPEASYEPGSKEFWGARLSDATMALVERGAVPTNSADKSVVARLDDYLVSYGEGEGRHTFTLPDGATTDLYFHSGFRLVRQDFAYCADGFDQACIERRIAMGAADDQAHFSCMIGGLEMTTPVEVPLDTEIAFKVVDRDALSEVPPIQVPCPKR